MYKIVVPATSANLGPGFDSIGVALDLYNVIEVEETTSGLHIKTNLMKVPTDENNLIYRSMKAVFNKVGYKEKGLRIIQTTEIPITRGLGSSSACIVGGILAANQIIGNKLTLEEMAVLAAKLEGHPDNTTAALMGGLVVSAFEGDELRYVKLDLPENLRFAAFIPNFTLPTIKARMVLPEKVDHRDAVFNSGRAALLIASLVTGNLKNLSWAFQDRLHQPYRKQFIPDMDRIFDISMKKGAQGCYLSGAGPTLIAVLDDCYDYFYVEMNSFLKSLNTKWELRIFNFNKKGAEIFVK